MAYQNQQNKKTFGFTLVELAVVITVLAILATISVIGYTKVQIDARDQARKTQATIVAEGLEKYYEKNGEYPSEPAIVREANNTGEEVAKVLQVDTDILLFPNRDPAITNALAQDDPSTVRLVYNASSIDPAENDLCQNDPNAGCDAFILSYIKEGDGTQVEIESRYSDRITFENEEPTNPTPDPPATITPPPIPSMTADLTGSTATGTVGTASCTPPTIAQYRFHHKLNNDSYGTWSGWSTSRTTSATAEQGQEHTFQAQARCYDESNSNASDPVLTSEASVVRGIAAPAAPTVNVAINGDDTSYSAGTIDCPAGTTARIQYRQLTDWGYDSGWNGPYSSGAVINWSTNNEGYEYTVQLQAHCYNTNATSAWSATGSGSYIEPVTAPGGATNYQGSMSSDRTLYMWRWTPPTCGSGASLATYHNLYVGGTWTHDGMGTQGWRGWQFVDGRAIGINVDPGSDDTFASGGRTATATQFYCKNDTTGRRSALGPMTQSNFVDGN